jgi:hypothetical protein
MEIRAITLFCDPDFPPETAVAFFKAARRHFSVPIQSNRLALPPFPDWWPTAPGETAVAEAAAEIAARWQAAGADYVSLGPAQLRHDAAWLESIPALLDATEILFATAEIGDTAGNLDSDRCWQMADVIRTVSALRDDGFGNLYLAALAHCPPGSPFFPVAYHGGGPAHFALAAETADLALAAFQESETLADGRAALIRRIEETAGALTAEAAALAEAHQIPFSGVDFSLAPFPEDGKSLGGAIEALGVPHVGAAGSLFAAGFITEAIERADFRRCGFSGLMLPVLEDSVLARRAAQGVLGVGDLLSYAAVCGVGLDTIPLPGDISRDSLAAILLDVAMLAARLRKPLTARLMPLPGLAAGDPVTFDFPYFADSRVMAVPGDRLRGPLSQGGSLAVNPIRDRDRNMLQ